MASVQMEGLKKIMLQMMDNGMTPTFGNNIDAVKLREIVGTAQMNMQIMPGVEFLPREFGGMEAECCMPNEPDMSAVIMYIHGGGLIVGNARSSRGYGSMLAAESRHPVYTFSYRLAPENPFPAAVDDCYLAYQEIEKENTDKPVFLIGESGGAYLCLTTTIKAKENGMRMPAGVIPYSPVIDFSGAIERDTSNDFTVRDGGLESLADLYCPDKDIRKNPLVSPYYADYTDFPPMLLAWDEKETLSIDSKIIVEKLQECNIPVTYKAYPDCFHAFATTGRGTPESSEIMDNTITFINKLAKRKNVR